MSLAPAVWLSLVLLINKGSSSIDGNALFASVTDDGPALAITPNDAGYLKLIAEEIEANIEYEAEQLLPVKIISPNVGSAPRPSSNPDESQVGLPSEINHARDRRLVILYTYASIDTRTIENLLVRHKQILYMRQLEATNACQPMMSHRIERNAQLFLDALFRCDEIATGCLVNFINAELLNPTETPWCSSNKSEATTDNPVKCRLTSPEKTIAFCRAHHIAVKIVNTAFGVVSSGNAMDLRLFDNSVTKILHIVDNNALNHTNPTTGETMREQLATLDEHFSASRMHRVFNVDNFRKPNTRTHLLYHAMEVYNFLDVQMANLDDI